MGGGEWLGEEEGESNVGVEVGERTGGERGREEEEGISGLNTTLMLVACTWESCKLSTWLMSS